MASLLTDSTTVVFDNGGCTLKAGFAGEPEPRRCGPNATGKVKGGQQTLIGEAIDEYADLSSINIRRPIERGYVVSWKNQTQIWDHTFRSILRKSPRDCSLLLSEPLFTLPAIQEGQYQAVFETLGCKALLTVPSAVLALHQHAVEQPQLAANQVSCGLVIDAGFSFTHIVPIFDGQVLESSVRRIDLGGKALTNYLIELVSYRSMDMRDEGLLMEHIKDAVSFVSTDLKSDLARAKGSADLRLEYVLPDGLSHARGYARAPVPLVRGETRREQVLLLNNERFLVPELVFSPSDIGLPQAGLPQMVADAALNAHPDLWPLLLSNVVLCGGMATCPGFHERLLQDLQPLVPDTITVQVYRPLKPMLAAWQGGSWLASSAQYSRRAQTRADYEENGIRDTQVGHATSNRHWM